MKKIIGLILVSLPFITFFAPIANERGLIFLAEMFGGIVTVVLLITVGVYLLISNQN